jgi:2,5-diketo-D-gluconate reductase B
LKARELTLSEADMDLIATLDRGQRLTSPKGIAPNWD